MIYDITFSFKAAIFPRYENRALVICQLIEKALVNGHIPYTQKNPSF